MAIQYSAYGYGEGANGTVVVMISDPDDELKSVQFKWRVESGGYGTPEIPDVTDGLTFTKSNIPLHATEETFVVPLIDTDSGLVEGDEIPLPPAGNAGGQISGDLMLQPLSKLYLDGGGNTYLQETSADVMSFFAGGSRRMRLEPGPSLAAVFDGGLVLAAGYGLYLDGGVDTYVYRPGLNIIDFVAGNVTALRVTNTYAQVSFDILVGGHVRVLSGNRIQLDGGDDTYLTESAPNVLSTFVGGTERSILRTTGLEINGEIRAAAGRIASLWGFDTEHFTFARAGSGTSSNPYYTWRTGSETVPVASFSGWDGASSKLFFACDYLNHRVGILQHNPAFQFLQFARLIHSVTALSGIPHENINT